MMSDDETMSDVPHPFVIGPAPSQAAQAAANDFLSCSTERAEAISALVKLPPDVMASILLANIPVDNSMDRQETNKIFKTFDYVKAGIQHRAKYRGVYFCNGDVKLPEETFVHVLGFLDKRDLIDNVSHVSYAWAKASLNPNVRRWQTIDNTLEGRVLRMLQRPQFTLLKKLFTGFELEDSFIEKIAQLAPRLEALWGFRGCAIAYSTETLCKLPTLFPKLNSIGVEMETSSSTRDVIRLVETIGRRLVKLSVKASNHLESGFTDDDFVIIGRHCPNLRSFGYWSKRENPHVHSVMTKRGLTALVEGCPKLEELRLRGTCRLLDPEAFGYIALNAKNLCLLNVEGNWCYQLDPSVNWTGSNNDEAIRKYFAKRLTRTAKFDEPFQYSLLPLP